MNRIQDKIASLKSLAVLDAAIGALEAELAEKRSGVMDQSTLKEGLEQRIARLATSISEMESTRSELVGEMRQASLQLDRSREKMMRCRNEREANAVQRELEELRRVFRERELETQKLVGLIDEARADLTAATDERDQISSEIDATGGAATTRIRELSANLATEQAKRESLLSELDGLIRRKYEIVRQKRGSGLAIAADGMCLSCHISLPPMLYQRIMHQAELFQCPSCQRILYVPREPAIEGSDASARDVESDRSEGEPGASDSEPTG